jgi:hypothetical protein
MQNQSFKPEVPACRQLRKLKAATLWHRRSLSCRKNLIRAASDNFTEQELEIELSLLKT